MKAKEFRGECYKVVDKGRNGPLMATAALLLHKWERTHLTPPSEPVSDLLKAFIYACSEYWVS